MTLSTPVASNATVPVEGALNEYHTVASYGDVRPPAVQLRSSPGSVVPPAVATTGLGWWLERAIASTRSSFGGVGMTSSSSCPLVSPAQVGEFTQPPTWIGYSS